MFLLIEYIYRLTFCPINGWSNKDHYKQQVLIYAMSMAQNFIVL